MKKDTSRLTFYLLEFSIKLITPIVKHEEPATVQALIKELNETGHTDTAQEVQELADAGKLSTPLELHKLTFKLLNEHGF